MKIGIISYHRAVNYGAVLQTYALQTFLSKIGYDVEVIDYKNKHIESVYKEQKEPISNKSKDIERFENYNKYLNIRIRKFEEFRKEFLKLSKEVNKEELSSLNYDIYITGSDQVWNMSLNGEDYAYLLDFVGGHGTKMSYAASFGKEKLDESYVEKFKQELKKFKGILVREQIGVKILESIGLRGEEVLDPTLLLNKDDWLEKFNIKKKKQNYIFVYAFSGSKLIIDSILKLSEKEELEIYWVTLGAEKSGDNIQYIKDLSPREFIQLLYNAKYVFTNSFHGIMFSLIFNKKFFIEYLPEGYEVNSRIENIVKKLELQNIVLSERMLDLEFDIDKDKVYKVLRSEIEESKNKLIELINI